MRHLGRFDSSSLVRSTVEISYSENLLRRQNDIVMEPTAFERACTIRTGLTVTSPTGEVKFSNRGWQSAFLSSNKLCGI
jgi:hypothetical protein